MNIKIDENSAAAQGGQSDRLVINSFRVSPRRRCDEKGGERGLSVAPSPLPLFFLYFVLEVSAGNLHVWGKSAEGEEGDRSSHARIGTISKRRSNPFPPSMRVEYVEYVENGATTSRGEEERGGETRSQLHGD